MNLTNLAVRLAGILMAAVPAGVQVFMHTRHGDSQHGELFTPAFYAPLLFLAFFGIPGIYVAAKGPMYGEPARTNRRGGIRAIVVGTGMLAVGGVLNAGLYFLGWLTGIFAFFWYGIIAVGAVTFALGLASVISGRNLLAEMGETESSQHRDS